MKRIILLITVLFLIRQWFLYSDPGSFSREEVNSLSSSTTLEEIVYGHNVEETLHLVHATVVHAGGFRKAGYCILQEGGVQLLVLTRGFPPTRHLLIDGVIVPRRVAQVGSQYLVIAALVAYRPAPRSEEMEEDGAAFLFSF